MIGYCGGNPSASVSSKPRWSWRVPSLDDTLHPCRLKLNRWVSETLCVFAQVIKISRWNLETVGIYETL